jgi:hypothetical protein
MVNPSRPHPATTAPPTPAPAPVSLDEESVAGEEDPGASIDLGLPPSAPAAPAAPKERDGTGDAPVGTRPGRPI